MAMSGLSRVRTELGQLLVIPSLAPHPVQANGESPGHGYLGDLPPPPQRQVELLVAPFLISAHCNLRRFYQQEAQQRVPLFRDVSQPSPIPTRLFYWHLRFEVSVLFHSFRRNLLCEIAIPMMDPELSRSQDNDSMK